MRTLIAFIAAVLMSSAAWGEGSCFRWKAGTAPGPFGYGSTASAAAQAWYNAIRPSRPQHEQVCFQWGGVTSVSPAAANSPPTNASTSFSVQYTLTVTGANHPTNGQPCSNLFGPVSSGVSGISEGMECPPPDQCSGEKAHGVGDQFTTNHYPGADGYCNLISHCRMKVTTSVGLGGQTLYGVTHTNEQCTNGAQPAPQPGDLTAGETCTTTTPEFCLQKSGKNCGYLNDDFVCLPKVGETQCNVASDGGRVCGNRAPTPPVPDNGTPGTAATPAATVQSTVNNVTTVLNYFNATQVANSSRDPGATGENPYEGDGQGGQGTGECEGEDCGEGSVSGGVECDAPPVCDGDALQCAVIDQQWRTRCPQEYGDLGGFAQQVGLGDPEAPENQIPTHEVEKQSFDAGGWLGSSSCPADFSVDLGDWGTYTAPVSDLCWVFQVIGAVMMIGAYLSAARIVVEGFG